MYRALTVFSLCCLAITAVAGEGAAGKALTKILAPDSKVERLATGMRFTEGPVWIPVQGEEGGGYLIFSDIPANELKKWSAKDGLTTFRSPSHKANGNHLDRQGRLLTCEHGSRRVTRTDLKTGKVTVLAERFNEKRLNSPNDAVESEDGMIWFTDPPYGLKKGTEGKEQEKNRVYRLDPKTGRVTAESEDFDRPNGLCFSPDGKRLYIADSGAPKQVRAYDVTADGKLSNGRVHCKIDMGAPDGIRCDEQGRLYVTAGDGVRIYAPDGSFVGLIPVPERPANCTFGGADGKTLFITARKSLYAVRLQVKGAR